MIASTTRYFWFLSLLLTVFGGPAAEPEPGKKPGGDIITQKHASELPLLSRSSDKSPSSGLNFQMGDWNIAPYYMHTVTLGSDAGGNRDEYREQARGQTRLRLGARLERRFGAWRFGGDLDIRGEVDAHRFSKARRSYFQALRTGNSSLFATHGDNFHVRVGRWSRTLTPEALVFRGDAPGAELGGAFRVGTTTIRLGLMGLALDREERIPYKKNGPSFFGGGMLGIQGAAWELALLSGFYRAPGRAAEPDFRLPGLPGTTVVVPTGQSARADLDVHYHGLRYQHALGKYDWSGAVYTNAGRAVAVDRGGVRQALTRKSIRGTMAHASVRLAFVGTPAKRTPAVSGQTGRCRLQSPHSGICVTNRPMKARWELEVGVLASTRDRDDTDSQMQGFGALRPGPVIMGGIASILLSGPPPGAERPPLRNTQPGRPFSDGGALRREPGAIRDNSDPARPDYENQGLNMGSVRLGYAPLSELRLDGFLNYGDLLRGDAFELIMAVQWQIGQAIHVFGAVSGTTYKLGEDEINPLTGLPSNRSRRYYSRYLIGAGLRF